MATGRLRYIVIRERERERVEVSARMGYDVERFVGYVNEGLLCCVCRDVLEEPLQAPCEHAFCTTCIHSWLVHHHNCPEDRLPLSVKSLRPLHRYMRNDLARLQVRCVYCPRGCEVVCALESLHRHEQQCDFNGAGCLQQLSWHGEEDALFVCSGSSGQTLTDAHKAQHNRVSELQAELNMLKMELNCKVDEIRREMESRLDSQRRHMVLKESLLKNEVDNLKGQLSLVMSEVHNIGNIQARDGNGGASESRTFRTPEAAAPESSYAHFVSPGAS